MKLTIACGVDNLIVLRLEDATRRESLTFSVADLMGKDRPVVVGFQLLADEPGPVVIPDVAIEAFHQGYADAKNSLAKYMLFTPNEGVRNGLAAAITAMRGTVETRTATSEPE